MQGSARKKILEAASDMFEHHGYYHVTTKDIARKARVNEATVFRLFGSKKVTRAEGKALVVN